MSVKVLIEMKCDPRERHKVQERVNIIESFIEPYYLWVSLVSI